MLKRLGKDIAVYGGGDFLFRLIAFAVFPVYAHAFSVEDFGIMSLAMVAAGLVGIFANVGLNNAVQRFYWDPATQQSRQPILVTTGLTLLVGWSVILILMLLISFYPMRHLIYNRYGLAWTIVVLAFLAIIPEQILQYALDTIRLHFKPWKFALISFAKNLLGVVIGLILIFGFDMGILGIFWGALAAATIAAPLAIFLIRKDLVLSIDSQVGRQLFDYGYPFIFTGIGYWIFGSMDRWMLAELSDNTQVGLYSVAFKFATVLLFLNAAFGQAWSPMAIKIRRESENYRDVYSRILTNWFFALVFVGAFLAIFCYEALYLLTPPSYWGAAPALGILVMGLVLSGTTQITALGISLERKTHFLAIAAWIAALANFLLNLILIPRWGALGAGFATCVSYGVLTGLFFIWSQKLHPIPVEKAKLIYLLFLVVAIGVLSVYFASLSWSVGLLAIKVSLLLLVILGAWIMRIIDLSLINKLFQARSRA